MPTPDTNYFVCTLGEAAQDGINRPYTSVNTLIDEQARTISRRPAIAFYNVVEGDHTAAFVPQVLTFGNVKEGIAKTAGQLTKLLDLPEGEPIGLLAASSSGFFFSWLGCIWLGHPVLLIAPQCSAAAIAHLCKTCDISVLLHDEKHKELVEKASQQTLETNQVGLRCLALPSVNLDDIVKGINRDIEAVSQHATAKGDDIAYLHHTSGTSSGLPKSIPQTHHGAVGVLPALEGKDAATFTTTPLYHGGPADIFRAWTSGAMIWLFPSKDMPITAKNVTKCLRVAQDVSRSKGTPLVKYFTSVPYVLQMMAEDEEGLRLLQGMDLVGVGGAALATEIGDKLVTQDVNLVSRFGSAECGFLLSSHRDYNKDRAWQYLRKRETVSQLAFESRDEDLHELVIRADWPHMAKRNREDGSYATSDLFAKHPDLPNAWRYHSRSDSQLTLVTGKKFDPAPLEDAIVAASAQISDVLLFGNGKPYPGALLFRSKSAEKTSSKDILAGIFPIVEKLNAESQSHARIPRNMLVVMPFIQNPLEKSSKGTILRKTAEESCESEIEASYNQVSKNTNRNIPDEDLPEAILDLVKSIVGEDHGLDVNADLFGQGIDSVACVQIRHGISFLLPDNAKKLPLTVVEDARTVIGLADLVKNVRSGGDAATKDDQRSHIHDLIRQFSKMTPIERRTKSHERNDSSSQKGINILLTGPTGSLGAHVLSSLLERPNVGHIYLLVRGASAQAARERVLKALSSRLLPIPATFDQRVTNLQCKLSEVDLGLATSEYEILKENVDLIFHLAWSVNFLLSLRSFTPHFAGIQNLLQLSLSSSKSQCPRLIFCSSVASVSAFKHNIATTNGHTADVSKPCSLQRIPERIIPNITAAGPVGYALSKLTAELLLAHIATKTPSLHKRISVIRVGQLSADTHRGVWNKSEAYPQILASAKFTGGVLPDLGVEEQLTWLPVDIAANAFVEAGLTCEEEMGNIPSEHSGHKIGKREETITTIEGDSTAGVVDNSETEIKIDTAAVQVLHLLNPDGSHTFTNFLNRLRDLKVSVPITTPTGNPSTRPANTEASIKIVPASQWLDALESLQSASTSSTSKSNTTTQTETQSPAAALFRLLSFWKEAYSTRQPSPTAPNRSSYTPSPFNTHNSLLTMPSLTHWLGLNTLQVQHSRYGLNPGKDVVQGSELLSDGYVERVWNWVMENVP